jgi:catechol 2,3-dioxygenase-like lactoylglutathione lyase family enzyme
MTINKTIPVFRIFDVEKALGFYIEWLGFKEDWREQFDPNSPFYIQISKENLTIHLSEHHGDGTPGSRIFVVCDGLEDFYQSLKPYKYYRPSICLEEWNAKSMSVTDPFGNTLIFNEYITNQS